MHVEKEYISVRNMKEFFKKLLGKHKSWFTTNIYLPFRGKKYLLFQFFGSKHIVTPLSVVRSIPECCWGDSSAYWIGLKNHVIDMQIIRHACIESYQYNSQLPSGFRTEMHFARRHVYRLRNVLVNPSTGACRIGTYPLQESYGALRECLANQPFPKYNTDAPQVDGLATCIYATGYYHFLLEEIPRLIWALDRYPNVKVYLSDEAPQFCRDILNLMIDNKIIHEYATLKVNSAVKMEDYAFTQADAYSGFVHSTDLQKLRNTFIPNLKSVNKTRRKIFISRKKSTRAFDNEIELEEVLANLGYQTVYLEQMSFDLQIELMQNSESIIAPHGAGLANLVWCHPDTKVIEIFSPRYMNDCFARLSSMLNLHYTPFWAMNTKKWGTVNIEQLLLVLKS